MSSPTPAAAGEGAARGPVGEPVARGIAAFISVFVLLNLGIELRHPGYNPNLWWMDFRPLPTVVRWVVLVVVSLLFLAYAIVPEMARLRRRSTRVAVELLWVMVVWNVANYYAHVAHGKIHPGFPVPFSLFVAAALGWVWWTARDDRPSRRGARTVGWIVVAFVACMVIFPVLQMYCFGKTSYRRKADLAVVFGARVYGDGTPSDALKDRVDKAVELYRAGDVTRLYLSGGRAEGEPDEAEAMRKIAVDAGVRPEDIIVDSTGSNTEATVANAVAYIDSHYPDAHPGIIAVSHFYHLPRVKMCFGEHGKDVLTVPVTQPLRGTPQYMMREVPALWMYYLRALLQ